MSTFGDNLKAARMAKKMTLVQCADALGITNPALSQWEQGKREPKFSMLLELCSLLETSPNVLLGVEPFIKPPVATQAIDGSPACSKCPIKKKLEKLEAVLAK